MRLDRTILRNEMVAELVKIDNSGEEVIKSKAVFDEEEAFEMLEDYILNSDDVDEFLKEEYARYASGDDKHGRDRRIGWLEKYGHQDETLLDAGYSVSIRIHEEEVYGDIEEDYYTESGVASVEPSRDDQYCVDVKCVCPFCGKTNIVTMKKSFWVLGCHRYGRGATIQSAFPRLNADEREMLKTGICNDCWDSMGD